MTKTKRKPETGIRKKTTEPARRPSPSRGDLLASLTKAQKHQFWTTYNVQHVIGILPTNVDEARLTLRLVELVLSYRHGDRWNYTAEEYDQYLTGKNPHGLKARRNRG
jgi:hypothetical protein